MTAQNTEDGAPMWLVLPTYNEASNLEAIVTAMRERLDPPRHCWSSTTPRPTAPADRRPLAAEHSDVSVLHRPRKEGLGPAYVAGFREALAGGATSSARWTPTSLMTRPTSRGRSAGS